VNGFVELPGERRRLLCEQAQAQIGLPASSLEKDLWVCWTLRELFTLPRWGDHLTFKGGTSLAKCWGLIERFSEDIDIVIDKEFLGFSHEDSPENAPSKKQRSKRLTALRKAAQEKIHAELAPILAARIKESLPPDDHWTLEPASEEEDPDQQTLIFTYPGSWEEPTSYIRPRVVIELGARSDIEPSEKTQIHPYLFNRFPELLGESDVPVLVLAAERTFWEKAMLLHEETYRPADKKRKARMARHYYDLWCLLRKGVAERAVAQNGLFERTARHREIYFNKTWVDYSTLRQGTLRLLPLPEQLSEWRRDYQAMRETMIFGEEPSFEEILRVVGEFQEKFNTA